MACWRFYCFLIFSVRLPVCIAMSSPCFGALTFLSYFATPCLTLLRNTPAYRVAVSSRSLPHASFTNSGNWLVTFCQVLFASYRTMWFALLCFLCQDHIPTCLDKLVQPCSWAKVICLSLTDIPAHDWKRVLVVVVPCAISLLCGQIWKRRRQSLNATWNPELPFSSDSFNPIVILYKLFVKDTIQERVIFCTRTRGLLTWCSLWRGVAFDVV